MTEKTKIGSGSTGNVYSRDETAVKLISRGELSDQWLREVNVLFAADHPNIIKGISVQLKTTRSTGCVEHTISMELGSRDLTRLGPATYETRLSLYGDVLRGLAYCHDVLGVLHRDLKPHNVILFESEGKLTAKLADFGMAAFLREPGGKTPYNNLVTTYPWRAPELWEPFVTNEYGEEIDTYSALVMGADLLFKVRPPGFEWQEAPMRQTNARGCVYVMVQYGFPVKSMGAPPSYPFPKVPRKERRHFKGKKKYISGHEDTFRYLTSHLTDLPANRPKVSAILQALGLPGNPYQPPRTPHRLRSKVHHTYTSIDGSSASYATGRRKEVAKVSPVKGTFLTHLVGMVIQDDYDESIYVDRLKDYGGVKAVMTVLEAVGGDLAGIRPQ
jgi:serine/threonine protein kinase